MPHQRHFARLPVTPQRRVWRIQKQRWRLGLPAAKRGSKSGPRKPDTLQRAAWREQKARRRALLSLF